MPPAPSTYSGDPDGVLPFTTLAKILQDIEAPVSEIIARSMITSSFNGEDRFEWKPVTGFRVGIPDRHSFVMFERESRAELRNRLFPFPAVRGNNHRSAPRPKEYPERSMAWWIAQLVHWGLPITINRDEAKESFKTAITEDKLEVPARLKDLEARLRRLYVMLPTDQFGVVQADDIVFDQTSGTDRHNNMTGGCQNPLKVPPKLSENRRLLPPTTSSKLSTSKATTSTKPKPKASEARPSVHQHDIRDATSSSDSDSEPTPKDEHMFTPRGVRITRPAEYPGLREREEQERQKKKKHKTLRKEALKNSTIEQEQVSRKYKDNHNEIESDADPASQSGEEDGAVEETSADETVVEMLPTDTVKEVEKAKDAVSKPQAESNSVDIWEIGDDSESESESEAGSVEFYTPMQFLKKRPDRIDSPDDASVVFTGYKHRPTENKRKNSGLKKFSADTVVRQEGVPSCKKLKVEEPSIKLKQSKQGTKSIEAVSKVKSEGVVAKHPRKKFEEVIDISTDDCTSDSDASASEGEREQCQRSVRTSTYSSKPGISSVKKPVKRGAAFDARALPEPKSEKKSRAKDDRKASKDKRSKDEKSKGLSENKDGVVRDYSDCGITEMSGGLHPGDQRVSRMLASTKETCWLTSPARSPTPELSNGDQRVTGLQTAPDTDDSEPELPSLADLFSTPDTPGAWKVAASNIKKAKNKKTADDRLPETQKSTAGLPSWLQTSMRNNSPELVQSKSSPTVTKSKAKHSKSKEKNRSERTRSASAAPTSRKRSRPTMIEIEAERPSALKRPRLAITQLDPASAALGVFRVNVPVQLPGSKKSKNEGATKNKKDSLVSQVMAGPKEKGKGAHDSKAARRRAKSLGAGSMRNVEL